MRAIYHILIPSLLLLSNSTVADNGNIKWEARVTEKLVANNETAIWLNINSEQFLGLYTPSSHHTKPGAVIILHPMGGHADWPQITAPVRTKLPQYGWSTLSIQLPIFSPATPSKYYGGTLFEAVKRINSAIRLLINEYQFSNIIIIGHSFGATSALAYLEQNKNHKVTGLVAIGLHDYPFLKPKLDILQLIQKVKLPIFDIYGSKDLSSVIKQADDRRLAAQKGGNRAYTQIAIKNADHYFNNMETVLVDQLHQWMSELGK